MRCPGLQCYNTNLIGTAIAAVWGDASSLAAASRLELSLNRKQDVGQGVGGCLKCM